MYTEGYLNQLIQPKCLLAIESTTMKLVIVLLAMAAWLSNVGVDSAPMLPGKPIVICHAINKIHCHGFHIILPCMVQTQKVPIKLHIAMHVYANKVSDKLIMHRVTFQSQEYAIQNSVAGIR